MSPLGIGCFTVKRKLMDMGRCIARSVSVLVAGASTTAGLASTTAAEIAESPACRSHPLVLASHPIVLDTEDLCENPSSADSNDEVALAMALLCCAGAAAGKPKPKLYGFYDDFESIAGADVAGVDGADAECFSAAEWDEALGDRETAKMYAAILSRGKAC